MSRTIPTRKKCSMTETVSALDIFIPSMTFIPIFQTFPVITCRCHWAVCGSLFAGEIRTFLGPRWPPQSLILSFARALRSPYQQAIRHRLHGVVTASRCFEGHHFILLFIQLSIPFQPSSLGPSVVYHHPYLLLLLRRGHCDLRECS